MKYFKCAACIAVLWFTFGYIRTDFRLTVPGFEKPSQTLNTDVDDSDATIRSESKSEDQDFIEKWSQSHPQSQAAPDEDPKAGEREGYFHVDQPDYFEKGQQKREVEDHWGMDKDKSIGR